MKIYFYPTVWSDMTVLESGGKFAAIDTGAAYQWGMISELTEKLGVKRLEFILITHFHPDHYGCLKALAEKYEVGTVYMKPFSGLASTDGDGNEATDEYRSAETENCRELMEFCSKRSRVMTTDNTDHIDFDGIRIGLYYTGNTIREVFEDKENECFGKYICNENQNSLMASFDVHGRTVVMGADITDAQFPHPAISMMNTRAAEQIARRADIYKAPHHGLGIGSDRALEIYRPEYTFITNNEWFTEEKTDDSTRLKKFNPDARIYYGGNGGTVFEISPDGCITAEKL